MIVRHVYLALAIGFVLAAAQPAFAAKVTGTITAINGQTVTLQTRSGAVMVIDATEAQQTHLSVPLVVNRPVLVRGARGPSGMFHATTILHAKPQPELWEPDEN
jgi:hypothetical protein